MLTYEYPKERQKKYSLYDMKEFTLESFSKLFPLDIAESTNSYLWSDASPDFAMETNWHTFRDKLIDVMRACKCDEDAIIEINNLLSDELVDRALFNFDTIVIYKLKELNRDSII